MGIETKYVCDKCGKSEMSKEETPKLRFFNLGVVIQRLRFDRDISKFEDLKAVWCDVCVAKAGFRHAIDVPEPKAKITMEDLVKNIIKGTK